MKRKKLNDNQTIIAGIVIAGVLLYMGSHGMLQSIVNINNQYPPASPVHGIQYEASTYSSPCCCFDCVGW